MRKVFLSVLILTCLLIPCLSAQAFMQINYEKEVWPMSVQFDSEDSAFVYRTKDRTLTLPSMTVLDCERGNISSWNDFSQIEPEDAQAILSAFSKAKVTKLNAKQFSAASAEGPAWVSLVVEPGRGEIHCLDFQTLFDGRTILSLQTPKWNDAQYFESKSKSLFTAVNKAAKWETYKGSTLKNAKNVDIYQYSESGRGEFFGSFDLDFDPKSPQKIGKHLANSATVKLKNRPIRYELVITLESGVKRSVYMASPEGEKKTMAFVVGDHVTRINEGNTYMLMRTIGDHLIEDWDWMTLQEMFIARPDLADGTMVPEMEESPLYFVENEEEISVYRQAMKELIATYSRAEQYWREETEGPGVFTLQSQTRRIVCSMADGNILWSMDKRQSSWDPEPEISRTLPIEFHLDIYDFLDGIPSRIVVTQGQEQPDVYTSAYLTDNEGNRVSRRYQELIPSVWYNETGIYQFGSYDPKDYEQGGGWADDIYEEPYEYGPAYTCGLIDQDGNVLVEGTYDAIYTLSPWQFVLERHNMFKFIDLSE